VSEETVQQIIDAAGLAGENVVGLAEAYIDWRRPPKTLRKPRKN